MVARKVHAADPAIDAVQLNMICVPVEDVSSRIGNRRLALVNGEQWMRARGKFSRVSEKGRIAEKERLFPLLAIQESSPQRRRPASFDGFQHLLLRPSQAVSP